MTAAISCGGGATVCMTPAEPGSARDRLHHTGFASSFFVFILFPSLFAEILFPPSGSLNKIQYCESKQMHKYHVAQPWHWLEPDPVSSGSEDLDLVFDSGACPGRYNMKRLECVSTVCDRFLQWSERVWQVDYWPVCHRETEKKWIVNLGKK